MELYKKEKHNAVQGQQQAERRARQSATAVTDLQRQLQTLRSQSSPRAASPSNSGGVRAGATVSSTLSASELKEVAAAISTSLVPSLGRVVRAEMDKVTVV